MNFKVIWLAVVLVALSAPTLAQETSLEQQLEAAKAKIAEFTKKNEELKDTLKSKEQEIAELRAKVDKLDAMIEEAKAGGVN